MQAPARHARPQRARRAGVRAGADRADRRGPAPRAGRGAARAAGVPREGRGRAHGRARQAVPRRQARRPRPGRTRTRPTRASPRRSPARSPRRSTHVKAKVSGKKKRARDRRLRPARPAGAGDRRRPLLARAAALRDPRARAGAPAARPEAGRPEGHGRARASRARSRSARSRTSSVPDGAGGTQRLRVYTPGGRRRRARRSCSGSTAAAGCCSTIDDHYDDSCRGLCNKTGAIVVTPDYRRAPEAVFPASHDDVLAAYRWIVSQRRLARRRPVAHRDRRRVGRRQHGARPPSCSWPQAGEALPVARSSPSTR